MKNYDAIIVSQNVYKIKTPPGIISIHGGGTFYMYDMIMNKCEINTLAS